jgi:hypothetical protein
VVATHEPDPDHDLVHVYPSSHLRLALEVDDVESLLALASTHSVSRLGTGSAMDRGVGEPAVGSHR